MISAMLLVVMLTLVMQYSRKHLAGTDFTFQVALMATVSGGLYSLSGILGDTRGLLGVCTVFNIYCMDQRVFIMAYCILG
ncbi:putative transport domain protein [Acinetobacter baumannii 348935]|nr:putative transport domain protein [Acinetobacter baumannii 348935]